MRSTKIDLSVIIPCHNEEKNVNLIFNEFRKVFDNEKINIEYVFIDDGSTDNTFLEIKKISESNDNVIGISFYRNFGKEAGIYAGLERASGDYITIIDADLQQHPKYVLEMYNKITSENEYDCICCYQAKRKESAVLTFCKKIFYKSINKISDVKLVENASDFRLFKSDVKDSLLNLREHMRFSKGLFSWGGYKTFYMPYQVEKRKNGQTSWNFISLVKYAIDGIIGFTTKPLKITSFVRNNINFNKSYLFIYC